MVTDVVAVKSGGEGAIIKLVVFKQLFTSFTEMLLYEPELIPINTLFVWKLIPFKL